MKNALQILAGAILVIAMSVFCFVQAARITKQPTVYAAYELYESEKYGSNTGPCFESIQYVKCPQGHEIPVSQWEEVLTSHVGYDLVWVAGPELRARESGQ
jgi:hypothetical protein